MLKVGITGGIGSGKTTICNLFKNLGVPIFSSDIEGRIILNEDDYYEYRLYSKAAKIF